MSDIMATAGLDISSFRNSLNQLNESTQKVSQGLKGNMLALGAGVAGVALVLTQSLTESQKNFTQLTKDAEGFSDQLANITASGGVNDIVGGLAQANQQMAQLSTEAQNAAGFLASTGAMISSWFGGDDAVARIKAISDAEMKLADARGLAEREIVRLLKIESEVIGLRNKGDDYDADVAEERLRLEKEISAIKQKAASGAIMGATADKMEAVAKAKSELKLSNMLAEEEKKAAAEKKANDDAEKKHLNEIDDFNTAMARRVADREQEKADEAQKLADEQVEAEKKRGEEADRASKKMQAAEQALIDNETQKKALKEQAGIQAGKVADAEQRLAKAAKGTAEWYERAAELAQERLNLENLIAARAKAYNEGTAAGRRFDREQKKQQKEDEKGRKRLNEQIIRENKRGDGKVPPVPIPGGGVAPKPIQQPNAPNAPAIGVAQPAQQVMRVQTIIVDKIQPK